MKKLFSILIVLSIGLHAYGQVTLPDRYHTYDEIKTEFDSLQMLYPDYVFVDSIGVTKTDSLPIWAVKLSDNAAVDEDEPAVLYVGQCHAEEVLGVEVTMYMINEILSHMYQTPYGIWLSELEIWFIPSINPEGLQVVMDGWDVSFRKTKRDNNLNGIFDFVPGPGEDIDGVDPNRNYSFNWVHGDTLYHQGGEERYDYYRGPYPFSEGGTTAVKKLAQEQQFLFSINWHSSRTGNFSEKVFYSWEWNGVKRSPDFDFNKTIGETVAALIMKEDGTGYYEPSPSRGRKGNAQDWFYTTHGTVQLLIECGTENLQPNPVLVDDTCERCKAGAYWLMNRTLGYQTNAALLTGHITDAQTGLPLQAEVIINDHDAMYFEPRTSDELYGRYWRLLSPGTYSVTFRKKGYRDTTYTNVTINNSAWTTKNVELEPLNMHTVNGSLHTNGTLLSGEIRLNNSYYADTLAISGYFSVQYYEGTYEATVISQGFVPKLISITIEDSMVALDCNLQTEVRIFEEDWEDGLVNWNVAGEWCLDENAHISNYALHDNDNVQFYNNNVQSSISSTSSINLNGVDPDVVLKFWHIYHTEWYNDNCFVDISENNQNWMNLATYSGCISDWQEVIIPLAEYVDKHIFLRFRFESDFSLNDPGWYIDDVMIVSSQGNGIDVPPVKPQYILYHNQPNPFRFITFFPYEIKNPASKDAQLSIYNMKGQLIRTYSLYEQNSMISWDGKNSRGKELGTGLYFYQLTVDTQVIDTKKCLFIK